jgi:hypothetical protein
VNLIIHHEQAWKAACQKYNLTTPDMPSTWPILISFIEVVDGQAVGIVNITTPEMAAKFLSVCDAERISKIDPTTRNKVHELTKFSGVITTKPLSFPPTIGDALVEEAYGGAIEKVEGDFIDQGQEPGTASKIPGLQELPIDPSTIEQKQKIADLGDVNEHVLDVERSV